MEGFKILDLNIYWKIFANIGRLQFRAAMTTASKMVFNFDRISTDMFVIYF